MSLSPEVVYSEDYYTVFNMVAYWGAAIAAAVSAASDSWQIGAQTASNMSGGDSKGGRKRFSTTSL